MPGIFKDNPRWQPVIFIGAREQLLLEQLPAIRMLQEIFKQSLEMFRRHRLVVVPPDGVFSGGVTDNIFVPGRAPGMRPGLDTQRARQNR